ncbi:MAG TPA: hypothetical protein VL527_04030 [Dongiaceae bacterium]|nr:hypothetical protein [Dongiaceae bacterium]
MKRIALEAIKQAAERHPNLWHELVGAGTVAQDALHVLIEPAKEVEILAKYGIPPLPAALPATPLPRPAFTPAVEDALTAELTRLTGRAPCRGCGR